MGPCLPSLIPHRSLNRLGGSHGRKGFHPSPLPPWGLAPNLPDGLCSGQKLGVWSGDRGSRFSGYELAVTCKATRWSQGPRGRGRRWHHVFGSQAAGQGPC